MMDLVMILNSKWKGLAYHSLLLLSVFFTQSIPATCNVVHHQRQLELKEVLEI